VSDGCESPKGQYRKCPTRKVAIFAAVVYIWETSIVSRLHYLPVIFILTTFRYFYDCVNSSSIIRQLSNDTCHPSNIIHQLSFVACHQSFVTFIN